jgi:hypothetical protein
MLEGSQVEKFQMDMFKTVRWTSKKSQMLLVQVKITVLLSVKKQIRDSNKYVTKIIIRENLVTQVILSCVKKQDKGQACQMHMTKTHLLSRN